MPNIKLIGFNPKTQRDLCGAIRLLMQKLGFELNDVVLTLMQHDQNEVTEEGICLYGLSAKAEEPFGTGGHFPRGVHISVISSQVNTLGGKHAPYVEVYSRTLKRIDEIVEYMKKKHLGFDVEKHLISPTLAPQEFKYPCVKIISSEKAHLFASNDIFSILRKLGVRWFYSEVIAGFIEGSKMR